MSRSGGKSEVICVNAGSTVAAKAGADAPGGGISLCFCRRGCAAPAKKAATLNAPPPRNQLKPPRTTTRRHAQRGSSTKRARTADGSSALFSYFCPNDRMKSFLIILGLILSCTFSDRSSFDEKGQGPAQDCVIGSENQDAGLRDFDWKSQGILPSRTAGFSGENNSVTSSVRSTNSGRRAQPSDKDPFRIIKDGKTIDKNNFDTFRAELKQFPSGIHSTKRYIHSICQLLI